MPLPAPTATPLWNSWVKVCPAPVSKMNFAIGMGSSVSNVGGWDLVLGGGVSSNPEGNTNDVYGYTVATDSWSTLPPMLSSFRGSVR